MIYKASRLSEGNKIFPAEIHIEENGIKVKIPGFLSGDTRFINYEYISAIDISTPIIGFATITLFNQGTKAIAHGFTKDEAKQIKSAIDAGRNRAKVQTINYNHNIIPQIEQKIQEQTQLNQTTKIIEESIIEKQVQVQNTQSDNELYSSQIEKLISIALADGELTEKEKQILFKKAEAEGIDLDEFEMVLDSKLSERKKTIIPIAKVETKTDNSNTSTINSSKCPSCGSISNSSSTRCVDCGHDFQNITSNHSIQTLFNLLQNAENNRNNISSGVTDVFNRIQGVFGVSNVDKNKLEIISSFPIPTTKSDIIEFLSLALPKTKIKKSLFGRIEADADKIPNMYANVWKQKCEQIIMKARFSMKEDKKTLDEIEHYANQLNN